jgi:integrase
MKDKRRSQFNSQNERAKYRYRQHLARVSQRDEKTVLSYLKHLRQFEEFIDFQGFEVFDDHIAGKYVQGLMNDDLSLSYVSDNIRAVKDFLIWLERQRGYRSKIDYNDIDYLNISRNQRNAAKAPDYQKAYTFDQIIDAIRRMPSVTEKQRRDRAIVSLQALCTLRINELRTVKLRSLIEENGSYFIYVSPRHMSVKFAKTRYVHFIPLPPDIVAIVIEWRDHLVAMNFKDSDPLFPKIDTRFGKSNLLEQKIQIVELRSDSAIREVFKKAFEAAGYPYIKPHNFRKTLTRHAEHESPAFLNAVRQNLGHDSIDTTLSSYGQMSVADQGKAISSVKIDKAGSNQTN